MQNGCMITKMKYTIALPPITRLASDLTGAELHLGLEICVTEAVDANQLRCRSVRVLSTNRQFTAVNIITVNFEFIILFIILAASREHILFKLCLLMYKAIHGLAPRYLNELCIPVSTVLFFIPLLVVIWSFLPEQGYNSATGQ